MKLNTLFLPTILLIISIPASAASITEVYLKGSPFGGESSTGKITGSVTLTGQTAVSISDEVLLPALPILKAANASVAINGEFVTVNSNVTNPTAIKTMVFFGGSMKGLVSVGTPADSSGVILTRPSHASLAASSLLSNAPVQFTVVYFPVWGQDGTYIGQVNVALDMKM